MKVILLLMFIFVVFELKAQQDEEKGLQISGSVDTYWKYDFSNFKNADGLSNIVTSFADQQNSISIGMLDVVLSQTVGKASFVGEFSFGPRSFKSIPLFKSNDDEEVYVGIQNLYVSYAVNNIISLTAGYMSTFIGYEVIASSGNFNYSTSHLFSNGPFQNSGIKADFSISDRFAFMIGLFNDWNQYQDLNGISDFGAQIYFVPFKDWDVYLNLITGYPSGTEIDLTTTWQISNMFYLALNAADFKGVDDSGGFSGVALYPQIKLNDFFGFGARYEFFKSKELKNLNSESVNSVTLSCNLNVSSLTIIPEYRIDIGNSDFFFRDNTKRAAQFLIAAVYAF